MGKGAYDKPNRRAKIVRSEAKPVSAEQRLKADRDAWLSSSEEERRKESRKRKERRRASARGERTFTFKTIYGTHIEELFVDVGIARDTSPKAMGDAWSALVRHLLENPWMLTPLGLKRYPSDDLRAAAKDHGRRYRDMWNEIVGDGPRTKPSETERRHIRQAFRQVAEENRGLGVRKRPGGHSSDS